MLDVRAIQEFYRYNRWANARVLEAVSNLTQGQFLRDLGSSYPSVRDTMTHVVWAEWLWLQRWRGISSQIAFQASAFSRAHELRARWLELEVEQRAFVDSVTAERLLSIVRYVNLQGQGWEYPLWRQMYHAVNHSTYHRGQVATLLRQLGARPAPTDFLVFHDEAAAGGA